MAMRDLDRPCKPDTAWLAIIEGFNANEIAHIWGVSLQVAGMMMQYATPHSIHDEPPSRLAA